MANNDALTFSTHDLNIQIYNASDLRLVYGGTAHEISLGELARMKTPKDETRYPSGKSGSYIAFAGPVQIEWRSQDGVKHSCVLDLDEVFREKTVRHTQDPSRIYRPMPITGGEPTIIIEVNNRTVSVYLFAAIQLTPVDPNAVRRDECDTRTLAYSKTF